MGRASGAICAVLAVAPCAVSTAYGQTIESRWQALVNTEARYFTWTSSRPYPASAAATASSGSQLYLPLAFQLVGRPTDNYRVEFLLRSAYVRSQQSGALTGTFSGTTDTTFSTTVTYYGWAGIQPFVSLNLNIPTGTSATPGITGNAKSDSDIVQLPAFGEGWNIGPSIGANIPLNESTVVSIGVGYTSRGAFNRESQPDPNNGNAQTLNKLNPGDVTTITGSIGWRGERLSLKGSAAYSFETVTTIDGLAFYQAGDRIILTGAAGYAWTEMWSSRAQVTFSHSEKNKVRLTGLPDLVVEAFNSNSNVIRVAFDTTYATERYSIGPVAGYVYRDNNSWDPTTYQFLPAKTSWSAGVAAAYAVAQAARVTARVERIWVHENDSPQKILIGLPVAGSAVPATVTDAWQFSIAGIFRLGG